MNDGQRHLAFAQVTADRLAQRVLLAGEIKQIVDDVLDYRGEAGTMGKNSGDDLREGKMTLPVIHLYAGGEERAQALLRRVVDARSVSADEWREIRALLTQARSLEYAQRTAAAFVERAKKALHVFPPSDARDALLYLPDYVVSRDR